MAKAFGILLFLGALFYWSAFKADFALHNDYQLTSPHSGTFWKHPETRAVLMLGRPINAVLLNWHSPLLQTLNSFRISRFFNFLVYLGICFWSFALLWRRLNVPYLYALGISVCLLFVPSAQLNILWVTQLIPITSVLVLALGAYELFLKGRWVVSAALFFTAQLIYPASTTYALIFPLAGVLFADDKTFSLRIRQTLFALVGCGVLMALYFVFVKLVMLPGLEHLSPDFLKAVPTKDKQFILSTNPLTKYFHFRRITEISFTTWDHLLGWGAGNRLWERFAILVVLVICGRALLLWKKGASLHPYFLKVGFTLAAVMALLVGMNAPILASSTWVDGGYRMQHAYCSAVIVLVFGLARYVPSRFQFPVLLIIVLATIYSASVNTSNAIANAKREIDFLRTEVSLLDLEKSPKVLVVGQGKAEILIAGNLDYEFRQMAFNYLPQFGILALLLKESKRPLDIAVDTGVGEKLSFLYAFPTETEKIGLANREGWPIIDLRQAMEPR